MCSKPAAIVHLVATITRGTSSRRLALCMALAFSASVSAALPQYEFLTVTGNGVGGNGAFSEFHSNCDPGKGIIRVHHSFPTGGPGPADNLNQFVDQSAFPNAFPNSGNQIQGHLAQTLYGSTSVVTFDLSGYIYDATTVFGMWNTTDEAVQPPYRVELLVNNVAVAPTMFQNFLIGNGGTDDNVGADGVLGRRQMDINLLTGDISAGAVINGGAGIHTNARFWHNIPPLTTEIRVYGNLSPIPGNTDGDGVGYYFAEICIPEPSSFAISAIALVCLGTFGGRRKR